MRIDSMDVTILLLPTARDIKPTPSENESDIKIAIPPRDKIISQISELERKELPLSDKVIINAIEKANRAISGANRKFEFSIHEKTKEIMVKVIDLDTNEVIREIPPEKILDMVAKMWEMAGIMVDERR